MVIAVKQRRVVRVAAGSVPPFVVGGEGHGGGDGVVGAVGMGRRKGRRRLRGGPLPGEKHGLRASRGLAANAGSRSLSC